MASVPHITAVAGGVGSFGGTRFSQMGCGCRLIADPTESTQQVRWRTAGVASHLYILVITNDRTAAGTVRTRKNAANGAQSISITALTTGHFEDVTNTDTISAGEDWNYSILSGTGGTSFDYSVIGCAFAATTSTVARYVFSDTTGATSLDTWHVSGTSTGNATEANTQCLCRAAGTLKNLALNVQTNSRDGATTWQSRLNGANGNLTVSVPAATTGLFEDTTNTDTIANGDLVNWQATFSGTTGTFVPRLGAVDFETTTDKSMLYVAGFNNVVFADTRFAPLSGSSGTWQATEANVAHRILATKTVSRLACRLSVNSINGGSTLTLRLNGADGSNSVAITAATTGRFEDVTHTDTFSSTSDVVDLKLVTTGSSGTTTMTSIGLLWGVLTVETSTPFVDFL